MGEIVTNHAAVFQYKSHSLNFGNVRCRIA